ncbi:MAG: FAD:protein FMN transferase [bacterium]
MITYTAMAGPCEILVRGGGASEVEQLASLAHAETARIERKFSRYRNDNIVHAINHSNGAPVSVDEETSRLLNYAGQCYELSDGRFDITSGVLRGAWTFDGRAVTPDRALWAIGIEEPGRVKTAVGQIELAEGGVATSGDSHRFCIVDGVRFGHILDPRTGWPVAGAPRSVTVVADTCTVAGFLATMAILHGTEAESFLVSQDVTYHCIR